MYAKHIKNYVINGNTPAAEAFWRLDSTMEGTLFVLDEQEHLCGFLHKNFFPGYTSKCKNASSLEICRRDVKFVYASENTYMHARDLFAQYGSIRSMPVVDSEMNVVDVLFKFQCFYKDHLFDSLAQQSRFFFPYPHYAISIWNAAKIAKRAGYDRFSVLEFGVAGGNGLVGCEYHAKEIGKIFNLKIDVYGFDTGEGLPAPADYRDMPDRWGKGLFPMDPNELRERLAAAKLILGDMRETCASFFATHTPAPIGVMLIDVDYYTPTVAALRMLEESHEFFLPIIAMYFDDTMASREFQGEYLAIKEFNEKHASMKISPEKETFGEFEHYGGRKTVFSKLKTCQCCPVKLPRITD